MTLKLLYDLGRIFGILCIWFALVWLIIAVLSSGSVERTHIPQATVVSVATSPVGTYHDGYNNVTCWYVIRGNSSIYCIPDAELSAKIESNTPHTNNSTITTGVV